MLGIFEKIFKKNNAPEWFCRDMKNRVPEAEIKDKIGSELRNLVGQRGYDKELWTDEYIGRVANLYYKFFDQLYMQS